MKFIAHLLVCILLFSCSGSQKSSGTSIQSPALTDTDLQANKQKIKANDASLLPAYQQLLKEADKALKEGPFSVMEKTMLPPSGDKHDYMSLAPYFWPDPTKPNGLPYIRKDGQTNPEVKEYKDKEYMPKMCGLVHTLALAYYFSGDERYAKHAASLLRTWYLDSATKMNPNLNYAQAIKGVNDGRGAGLIDARHFVKVIEGINLLQNSEHWTSIDNEGMKTWFGDFLHWMQTSKIGKDEMNAKNNHGTFYDALRLSIALFINDKELANKVIANATKRLDDQMDDEGKFPKEMVRTISLHYSSFNMEAFFKIAAMSDRMGFDFWNYTSPSGKSLKKGFDFLHPFITKTQKWDGPQIKPYDFEEDAFPLLMIAAKHYKCTDCKEAIQKISPDKFEKLRINLLY